MLAVPCHYARYLKTGRRHFARTALLAGFMTVPGSREFVSAAQDQVTVLDPIFVEASSGDPWRYFSVPGFEVISHCPDSFNESYARALWEATAARLALLPESFWGMMPTPIKVVLYDREPDRSLGGLSQSPIDLSWSYENGSIVGQESVQFTHPVIVGDGDTFICCGNYWDVQNDSGHFSADPDSDIRMEIRAPRFPAWFIAGIEGPRGLYAGRVIESTPFADAMVLPNTLWISSDETIAIQKEAKDRKKYQLKLRALAQELLPPAELFSRHIRADQENVWNSESALLVRWGLFKCKDRRAFLDFVDSTTREPTTELLFTKYLGMGYADLLRELGEYIPTAASESITVPIAIPPHESLKMRDASTTEVARIIGDWGRLEGKATAMKNFSFHRECMEQADKLFARASARRRDDPLFLAALGLYKLQVGDDIRARDALDEAVNAGVVRPRAYVELARLRLSGALPAIQRGIGDLSGADYADIMGLLTTARMQMPSLLPCYQMLAQVLEHAPSRPGREDLVVLDTAVHLFPENVGLACRVASMYKELGYHDEAAAIIEHALLFADSDEARVLLSNVLAR
jgi:hypothetical protein